MDKNNRKILVLGGSGMLGRAVYTYLSSVFPQQVWMTTREKGKSGFHLEVKSVEIDLKKIIMQLNNIDYIINCIGALNNSPITDLTAVNAQFPHKLAQLSENSAIKILHISTDAVFSASSGGVSEKSEAIPDSDYGKSKLEGEVIASNFLSFRTSIIGFDPKDHKSTLEWVLNSKNNSIKGFVNQIWSGCTVLQYAMLCEKIIEEDSFHSLRKKSPIFHFSPILPISKYQLIKDFSKLKALNTDVIPVLDKSITRYLITNYAKDIWLDEFTRDHIKALKELIEFERMPV